MPALEWRDVLELAAIIFAAGGFYAGVRGNKKDLRQIQEDLKMLNKAVADIAVQNARLDNQDSLIAAGQKAQAVLEERLWRLSQGQGFIQSRIDGEYPKS
jgi:hypothetical protein